MTRDEVRGKQEVYRSPPRERDRKVAKAVGAPYGRQPCLQAPTRSLDAVRRSGRWRKAVLSDQVASVHKTFWQAAWHNPILLLSLTALIWAGHALVGRMA